MYVSVVVVLAIACQLVPLSIDDSHLITAPICPVSVMLPLLLPLQTVVAPAVVPPIEGKASVIVTVLEFGVHGGAGVIVQVNWYV
jgi:hypothetical protein